MENASKALIMAATVLLGVMIISVGVALFNSFSDFSITTLDKVEETKIAEWNNQFLKYKGTVSTYNSKTKKYTDKKIQVTAHDIITVANLAKQNNEDYELTDECAGNENTYYMQVKVVGSNSNFETLSDSDKNRFLKENSLKIAKDEYEEETLVTKYYECVNVKISEVTKRVMYIEFKEL